MSPWLPPAVAGLGALSLAAVLTEPMRRLALRRGYTDQPSARKSHDRPTPYLGGIAVALATLACAGATMLLSGQSDATAAVLLVGGAMLAVLGLIDDLRPLSVGLRLCVETAAAVAVVVLGGHPVFSGTGLDVVLAAAWIVFTTNAFNLLDNMDGVVSTVTTVTAGFLCGVALSAGLGGTALLMAALAGACAGFLVHNWHPARIFLGDAGSLFVGFLVSSVAVTLHKGNASLPGHTSLLLITLVVTTDTALVLVARRRAGRPLLQGGTDHIAHRLRRLGLTVRQITLAFGAFAALTCLSGVLVMLRIVPPGTVLVTAVAVTTVIGGLLLRIPV